MSNFSNNFPSGLFLTPVVTIYSLNSYFYSIAKMQSLVQISLKNPVFLLLQVPHYCIFKQVNKCLTLKNNMLHY